MENRGQMKAAGFVAFGIAALFALVGLGFQDSQSVGSVSGKAGQLFLGLGGAFFVAGLICLLIGIGKLNPKVVRRTFCAVVLGGLLIGCIYGSIEGSRESARREDELRNSVINKDPWEWTDEEKEYAEKIIDHGLKYPNKLTDDEREALENLREWVD